MLRMVPLPVPGRIKKGRGSLRRRAPLLPDSKYHFEPNALRRRAERLLAFLPVAGAELVGLERVEDAERLLRVAAG